MNTKRLSVELLFLSVLALFVSAGCQGRSFETPSSETDLKDPKKQNSLILRVGESTYTNADFLLSLAPVLGDEENPPTFDALSRLFDNFVEERIILAAARSRNLEVTEEERNAYLEKLNQMSGSIQGSSGASSGLESGDLLERLLIEKYTYLLIQDIDVSEDEISVFYEAEKRSFLRPERVKVSQILVETQDVAIGILEQVKESDEAGFKAAARESSTGVEAEKGGLMGVFEMGQLPPDMEKVVFSLEEGEISPVVESTYGFHIFRLDKRYEPKLVTLEEAVPEIRARLLQQKIKQSIANHVMELKTNMEWTSYPENLSFPYQRQINEDM